MLFFETGEIHKKFLVELSNLVPQLSSAGQDLLDRVSTPNWALEWGLPVWLSEKFGFDAVRCEELLLSNIFMIAYARLLDDLADHESQSYDSVTVLSSAVHHVWVRQYIRLLGTTDPQVLLGFWKYFDDYTGEWLRATSNLTGDGFPRFDLYTKADFERLAARGAFLKICPAAACLLAGRSDLIPYLVSAVEYLTVGVVMLDEQFDWAKDLDAGRYNTFVAYCSNLPQTEEYKEANHTMILREIYLQRLGQPYFDILCAHLQQARHWAALADCNGLVAYIDWFDDEVRVCNNYFAETARSQIQSASERFNNNRLSKIGRQQG